MPQLEYFLVGGSCAVDQLSGRISIFDILVEVRPNVLPAAFPKLVSVASFVMSEEDRGVEFQFSVRTTMPDGGHGPTARLNFAAVDKHYNLVNNWMGLPILQAGSLLFEARLNDEPIAHHTMTVHPADAGRQEPFLVPIVGPRDAGGELRN